jgi:hypothetical protein
MHSSEIQSFLTKHMLKIKFWFKILKESLLDLISCLIMQFGYLKQDVEKSALHSCSAYQPWYNIFLLQ